MNMFRNIKAVAGSLFDNLNNLRHILNVSKERPSVSFSLPVDESKLCLFA